MYKILNKPQSFSWFTEFFLIFSKLLNLFCFRGDSDVIAKMKGTFTERPKRLGAAPGESKKKKKKEAHIPAAAPRLPGTIISLHCRQSSNLIFDFKFKLSLNLS